MPQTRGVSKTDTLHTTAGEVLYSIWRERLLEHSLIPFPEWRLVSGDLKTVWEVSAARFMAVMSE